MEVWGFCNVLSFCLFGFSLFCCVEGREGFLKMLGSVVWFWEGEGVRA